MEIAVCTTLTAFAMHDVHLWAAWLSNAAEVKHEALRAGADVRYHAVVELDSRGLAPFDPLMNALDEVRADYWTFTLDDKRTEITTANRLRHITMGQNLAVEYATSTGADWLLFLAADCRPPADVIPKLLELHHPLVGCEVPTYCLTGPRVERYPFPVEEQLISAAAIFVRRDVFKVLRWRSDADEGMSDDPSYRRDAQVLLGVPSYVRKDCVAQHYPAAIGPIESRFPGADMRVYR